MTVLNKNGVTFRVGKLFGHTNLDKQNKLILKNSPWNEGRMKHLSLTKPRLIHAKNIPTILESCPWHLCYIYPIYTRLILVILARLQPFSSVTINTNQNILISSTCECRVHVYNLKI